MKGTLFGASVLSAVLLASGSASYAQGTGLDAEFEKNLALMRKDLRSGKKQILAANLPLTDTEATKFWPIYDQYVAEMKIQYDRFYDVIKDWVLKQKSLTDEQALDMIKRWSDAQVEIATIRQKYIPLVEKVLPGKKAATFFQIDRRLYMMIDLQLASELPIIQP